jgi:hypothetical protein
VSLGWYDLRRTVRRRGPDAPAQAYPFLLRDDRLYPQLALAVEYFESMVGRPRAELDGEVLVQFFADHRLARGVVAGLAGHYQYRRQGFADALDPATGARLAEQGVYTPIDLRAALYDDVNRQDGGFAADTNRAGAVARLAARLDLAADAVEALLVLDAEDRAPLVRLAAPPSPTEVAAIYNHLVADAVLRAAARVDLELAKSTGRGSAGATTAWTFTQSLAGHAALAGLRAEHVSRDTAAALTLTGQSLVAPALDPDTTVPHRQRSTTSHLALLGEQDAVGSWTRHGRRLVRALGKALSRHPTALAGGTALVHARGGPYACALNPEFLRALVGPAPSPENAAGWTPADAPVAEAFWDPRPEMAVLRQRGEAAGWSLRNWPAALVYPEGVLYPECALIGAAGPVYVVLADTPALTVTTRRLADRLAARGDVLIIAGDATSAALSGLNVPLVTRPTPTAASAPESETGTPSPNEGRTAPEAGELLRAVLVAAAALRPRAQAARSTPLDHLLQAVRAAGFLPPERALTLAGCGDEAELAGRLAAAAVDDVHFVPGVGLHTEAFLQRLHGGRAASGVG